MDFSKGTLLLDKILENGCLSENDYENIVAKNTNADKVRLLIRKIKDRGNAVIHTFLEVLIIDQTYEWLADKVRVCADKFASSQLYPTCVVCMMIDTVDIKEIVDVLWKKHIITDEMHGKIAEANSIYDYRCSFWDEVFCAIKDPNTDSGKTALEDLCGALHQYEDIVNYLTSVNNGRGRFGCCCSRRRKFRPRQTDSFYDCHSDSEYSTTSKALPSRDLLSGYVDNDSQTEFSSLDQTSSALCDSFGKLSFERLERFEEIRNSSNSIDERRVRHTSGDFVPGSNTNIENERFNSLGSLPFIETMVAHNSDNTHQYVRSNSNITVQAKHSSSDNANSSANHRSSSSDAAVSPELRVTGPQFKADCLTNYPSASVPDQVVIQHDAKEVTSSPKIHASVMNNEDTFADTEDGEDERERQNMKVAGSRSRKNKRNMTSRDFPLTAPRKVTDPTNKVAPRAISSKMSKRSRNRKLRRQRSYQESEDTGDVPTTPEDLESTGMKKPFNPLRDKILTPILTPKWDYNQVLRRRQMDNARLNISNVFHKSISDNDFRTEESETMTASNCTL